MLKFVVAAAWLLGAPAAFSQTVASCATAAPGTAWNKDAFLPCSAPVAYVAQPVPPTAPVSDMRCTASGCSFSWQLGPKVLPTDQVWVRTTSKPGGTWVSATALKFAASQNAYAQCTKFVYTGAPFALVTTTGPATSDGLSVSTPVLGFVQLAAPLPLNGTSTFAPPNPITQTPGIVDWNFSSEGPSLNFTSAEGVPGNQPTFTFTTVDGVIVSWNFTIPFTLQNQDTVFTVTVTGSMSGDSVSTTVESPILPYAVMTGSSNGPGLWSCEMSFTAAGTP